MGQIFFFDGPDNTSKIFVQNIIIGRLCQKDGIVLDVASSSIAAMLLDRSFTTYSWFKIPLNTTNESMWNIKKKTDCAKLIK